MNSAEVARALEQPYELPTGAADRFAADGFIRLAGVLDPGIVEFFEPEVTSQVIRLNPSARPMAERDTYGRAFLQVMNLWRESELVRQLACAPRLARIAADLLGVRAVRMYHDQALYKEPSGGITPWHADQYYWPVDTDRICTIWLPLQQTPLEMGPLAFARGSHRFTFGRDLVISDESEAELQLALAEQRFAEVMEPYELGEASYHLGWTFHHAGPNTSTSARRVMTMIYVDADAVITEPTNPDQRNDIDRWMPGQHPGQRIGSELNPVLFASR